ncbi:MAG: glycoside hydrolase family 28 protein [Verrucomicrobiae bacterium]|nr:glycoside hydrolase family 28 protein [Verrucomicrobiae bacterium]
MKHLFALVVALGLAAGTSWAADKPTLNVIDFGAKGDGVTKDTDAIQKALDACGENGGGTVLVPDGVYLTGSLQLHANTTLQFQGRSSLLGSPDIADYPLVNVRWEGEFREGHRALISATDAANVTITGGGIFGPPLPLGKLRNPRGPVLIELTGCTNALLEGFTTQYQQLWSIHVLFCKNFTARSLTVRTVYANGDGLDVDSCDGVTIDHCDIDTGDDAISLKSGRGLAAQNLSRPTENVIIRDCQLQSSKYAAIGLGTEMSGGIRNVKIVNCVISGWQNAIFIKSRDGRGGYMEDITGEDLTVLKSPTFIGIDLMKKGIQATDPVPGDVEKWPRVHNLTFKNIRVQDVAELVDGRNVPAARPIDGFTLADISGTCGRAISLANMTNVNLSKIRVSGFEGALITTNNVHGKGLNDPTLK